MDGSSRALPRLGVVALGCRVSRADADALAGALRGRVELAGRGERADVVIVNGCALTADAEAAARREIRRAARGGARVIAAGCCARLRGDALARLPAVAAVVGARADEEVAAEVARVCGAAPAAPPREDVAGPARHTRPFLKVQDGCDAACAYCVVPLARGRSRSTPPDEALRRLAALGARHPEVVLTGVHLGAYGRDLAPRTSLEALVRAAARRRLVRRLRLSSLDPAELPPALLADADARALLCEHFHLPLQSGSPRVLAAMGRAGGADAFRRAVLGLEARLPGACVGADVLAGFPGERDEDHRATLDLVASLPVAYLHVFPFSPRPGTAAAAMPGAVPPRVAKERARELRAASERAWARYAAAQVGRAHEVVVERVAGGVARGTAGRYVTVRWPASGERRGELARVLATSTDGAECLGARVPDPG